jgi:DNA polymerase I
MSDSSPPSPPRLLLIDGSGFIFRAYHKLPPLTRSDGTPTNAVYGFTTMLLKLREQMHFTHAVVVFDAKGGNFRHDIYPAYKANRAAPPEDLIPQFPLVREAAIAMNLPIIEQAGMEADDIIATHARQAREAGMEVCIVSSDKDLMQMIGGCVTMFDPMKNAPLTEADVLAKFGVTPDKVVEVQSLMGDSSDNIPGVPSIGAKTAAELILRYGTLESLLSHTHEITQPKRRAVLETHRDQALLSKQLVTLRDDCEGLPELESYAMRPVDAEQLAAFCVAQGFKSLVGRIRKTQPLAILHPEPCGGSPATSPTDSRFRGNDKANVYTLIQSLPDLIALVSRMTDSGMVAFDVETTSLDATQADLVGISLSITEGEAYYVPLAHKRKAEVAQGGLFGDEKEVVSPQDDNLQQIPLASALALLKPVLESPSILKIGHNIKYDGVVMETYDVTVAPIDDTMLISYCLGAGAGLHNMDSLAEAHLGITPISFKDVTGTGKAQVTFDYVPLDVACNYAAEDADITLRLYRTLKPTLMQEQLVAVYERMERALVPVVVRMERHGVRVDKAWLAELSHRFATEMTALEQEIYQLAGHPFNIASPKQLGEILFDELALGKGKKSGKTGAYVTDSDVLEELALIHELPAKVLAWRQLAKLKSTYTDALTRQINPKTGRVHTSYSLASTSTGRLSSSDPNLQNIPIRTEQGRLLRNAFIAEEGFTLMSADYSQIELRLLAHIANIEPLKAAFRAGQDVHAITAAQVFGVELDAVDSEMRRKAKTINFGIIYGISAHGLSTRLGIPRSEAAAYIDAYFAQYGGIKTYMERAKEQAREYGYVTTLWRRRCHTPMIADTNPNRRAFAERAAINAPLQGSAADIIKRAMIAVDKMLHEARAKSRMLLQVHDELVFEIAHGEEPLIPHIKRTMEQVAALDVPLVVDTGVGKHWGEAH